MLWSKPKLTLEEREFIRLVQEQLGMVLSSAAGQLSDDEIAFVIKQSLSEERIRGIVNEL